MKGSVHAKIAHAASNYHNAQTKAPPLARGTLRAVIGPSAPSTRNVAYGGKQGP